MFSNSNRVGRSLFITLFIFILINSVSPGCALCLEDISNSPMSMALPLEITSETFPGRFTIIVEPLTENIMTGEDTFVLYELNTYAAWRFTYKIENLSTDQTISEIVVKDSFGAELDIIAYHDEYSESVTPGVIEVWTKGNMHKYFFNWDGFNLAPGQWALITIDVATGLNPAGKQEYTSCGTHDLNSEGTLWYNTDKKREAKGFPFKVKIPCKSYMSIYLSGTNISWFVRKPGDFFIKAVEGSVTASHPITITFSDFNDLCNSNDTKALPIYYALNTEGPDHWIPSIELNNAFLVLNTSNTTVDWNMWQRLIVDEQSVGYYANRGVITFTLLNMEIP